MEEIINFLKRAREKKGMILLHSLADVDAVGGGIALSSYLKGSCVASPDSANSHARKLLKFISMELGTPSLECEFIVLLDTNSRELIGDFPIESFGGEVCIIDHHSKHPDSVRAKCEFIDNRYSSACEIVYEILVALGHKIDEKSATCLLAGIMADSVEFKMANKKTFKYFSELLGKTALSYAQLRLLLEEKRGVSDRIAVLKAAKRASLVQVGEWIVATSKVSSFESQAAAQLIELGADISFVGSSGRREARVSARMQHELADRYGMSLSAIMEKVGKILKGSGGGHPCAAGSNGPALDAFDDALEKCVELAVDELEKRKFGKAKGIVVE